MIKTEYRIKDLGPMYDYRYEVQQKYLDWGNPGWNNQRELFVSIDLAKEFIVKLKEQSNYPKVIYES